MTHTSRHAALILSLMALAACQQGSPSYSLNPDDGSKKVEDTQKPGGDLGEAESGDPSLWPSDLSQIRVVCENPRGLSQRASTLRWTSAGASPNAGFRLILFKVGEKGEIPAELRRPLLSSRRPGDTFDLIFEGDLDVGPSGGLSSTRTHMLLGRVFPARTEASIWSVLPSGRLETSSSRMKSLPQWVRLSHALEVNKNDFVLPAKSGSNFELFSKNDQNFDLPKGLGLALGDSFPAAAFDDAVIFSRNTGNAWTLTVVDNLRGTPTRMSVSSNARFVSDVESDAFWAWSQKSSKEWSLSRFALRSGSYTNVSGPSLKLSSPYLARRFEVGNRSGWILARDDLRKIQIFSENFELSSELPYPAEARFAIAAEKLRKNSPVFVMEFAYGPGEFRASLVHALRSELRGPLTQGLCARPSL
jgi:hypothetical protein